MNKRRKIQYRLFRCPVCTLMLTIPKADRYRTMLGHIKDMYCPFCKQVRKFEQIDK